MLGRCRTASIFVLVVGSVGLAPSADAASAPLDLWVDRSSSRCSDSYAREQTVDPSTPWCSLIRAAGAAESGDTVRVRPGRYAGTVRPRSSGQPGAPTRYIADAPGVVVDAAGADAAMKVVGVADIVLSGLTVTGAGAQGVWVDGGSSITLDTLTVEGNAGHGVQIVRSAGVAVQRSTIRDNEGAGIFEGVGTSGGRYVDSSIVANGVRGGAYNGDGIQLGGEGAYVARNVIARNGTPGPYEHGIYAGPSSRGYLIEHNAIGGNAGSNVKAAGAAGVIRYNRLEGGRLGLVFSDNPSPAFAYYNLIFGSYQHAVFLTDGQSRAQAKVWNNTIVVTSRSAASGDASAVFVKAATLLDLRNNVVTYTNADSLGVALYVSDTRQLSKLVSDNNWFSSREPKSRHFVLDGSRQTLATWRRATGQDGRSVSSSPPTFDADARVTSKNAGVDRGQPVGLSRDYAGRDIRGAPDLGAYEA